MLRPMRAKAVLAASSAVVGLAACGSSSASSDHSDAGSGGQSGCRGQKDCQSGWFCAAYTLPPLCGGQYDTNITNDCQVDGDCADAGSDFACLTGICVFPHGGGQPGPHCRKGCSVDADCGPGLACTSAHHCETRSCAAPGDCGPNYTCSAGKCQAAPCSADSACQGYCVNGSCSATLGECEQAVP